MAHVLAEVPVVEPRRRPTYADIEALPEHVVGEILAGELVVSPRPAPRHAVAASRLGALLMPPYDLGRGGPGGWRILFEPELALDVDPEFPVVVPDVAGWLRDDMPSIPETAQVHTPPAWVCEVLSPGSARRDRTLKVPFYGRAGVQHVWLVDPQARTVEVFARDDSGWRLAHAVGGHVTVELAPFSALKLELELLWS